MNPFLTIWIVVDLAGVIAVLAVGRAPRSPASLALWALMIPALGMSALSVGIGGGFGLTLVWVAISLSNIAFGVSGFLAGSRLLAVAGLAATAGAIALIALGAFSSLPVAAVALALCAGAAIVGARRPPQVATHSKLLGG